MCFTKYINPDAAKSPLKLSGGLVKFTLNSFIKYATVIDME